MNACAAGRSRRSPCPIGYLKAAISPATFRPSLRRAVSGSRRWRRGISPRSPGPGRTASGAPRAPFQAPVASDEGSDRSGLGHFLLPRRPGPDLLHGRRLQVLRDDTDRPRPAFLRGSLCGHVPAGVVAVGHRHRRARRRAARRGARHRGLPDAGGPRVARRGARPRHVRPLAEGTALRIPHPRDPPAGAPDRGAPAPARGRLALRRRSSEVAASGGPMIELSAVEALALLRRGDMRAEDYATALLARCDASRRLNAFISIDPDAVKEAARAADRRRASGARLGPLHGLPIPVKDSVNTADLPTTSGTASLRGFRPREDAPEA